MKLSSIYTGLLATAFATLGTTNIVLEDNVPANRTVNVGDVIDINWSNNVTCSLTHALVRKGTGQMSWLEIQPFVKDRQMSVGQGSYQITMPDVAPEGIYALWYGCGRSGGMTEWFSIEGGSGRRDCTAQVIAAAVVSMVITSLVATAIFLYNRRISLGKKEEEESMIVQRFVERERKVFFDEDGYTDEKAEARALMEDVHE